MTSERPTLHGRDVDLVPLDASHGGALARLLEGRQGDFPFLRVPETASTLADHLATLAAEHRAGTSLPFVVVERSSSAVVGMIRFADVRYWNWPKGSPHQRGEHLPDGLDVTGWIAKNARRKRHALDALGALLAHAFESCKVYRARSFVDDRNDPARALFDGIGAVPECVLRWNGVGVDGAIVNHISYSVRDHEWPAVRARIAQHLEAGRA